MIAALRWHDQSAGHDNQAEVAQARVIGRASAERPMILAIEVLEGNVAADNLI
jgi:hypothetical protein